VRLRDIHADRASDGAFSAGRYVIALPADAFTIATPTKTSPLNSRNTNRVTPASVEQLALLPN
jgi:hypothetical protein